MSNFIYFTILKISMTNKDFFDEGESQLYVGKLYLILIAQQMTNILRAQLDALLYKNDHVLLWLNQLKAFYDIIENQLSVKDSNKEIEFFEYKMIKGNFVKSDITIKIKEKFEKWFSEIEKMFERNKSIESLDENLKFKYNNDKKILLELSRCQRELYIEANKKHLIMPDVKLNMKELAKSDWIDRDTKKNLFD